MKRLLQLIVLGTAVATFALPALAQDPAAAQTATQDEATAKSDLYKKFTAAYNRGKEILKADPNLAQPGNRETYDAAAKEAYNLAKEYVQKYPTTAKDDAIFNFQRNYITTYENSQKEGRKKQLSQLFNDKKYDEAFALGRQILNDDPNDLATLHTLARGGLFAAGTNETNNAATAQYAKKAIQLIQAGGTVPGMSKEEALGVLNYALGVTSIKTMPSDAVNAFYQVATIPNPGKNDPQTFYLLAVAYQASDYEKLASDYKAQCTTAEQVASPTCKAMTDRLNAVVDRVIDAYARAVALSGSKPNFATARAEWMKSLTDFYKYRHEGKEDGLKEYIAGIANQPLPALLPPAGSTPAPTSATPTPSATPTGTGDGASTGSTSTTMTTTTTTTTPVSTTPVSTKAATTAPATSKPATAPKTTTRTSPKKAHAARRH
jgi:hypothetical protein